MKHLKKNLYSELHKPVGFSHILYIDLKPNQCFFCIVMPQFFIHRCSYKLINSNTEFFFVYRLSTSPIWNLFRPNKNHIR